MRNELLKELRLEDLSGSSLELAEAIGMEGFIRLVDNYEGTSNLYVPKASELIRPVRDELIRREYNCALPGFVDSKNEEKTERNAGYLVVSHSGGGMLRQGTRKGIRRTPANRGMRAHWVVKGLDISEDVCHGMCP